MTISVLDALNASEVADASELPCRANDAELWFAESPADVELAKALCRSCPVRAECLSGAIDRREPWGVWGGEIFERGEIIGQKRARGRLCKRDIVV